MIIADQLEERALLCLEGRNSYMGRSLCSLPARVSQQDISSQFNLNSSDDERYNLNARREHRSMRNNSVQLNSISHNLRDLLTTVKKQLEVTHHNIVPHFLTRNVASTKHKLMLERAQELPSDFHLLRESHQRRSTFTN